MAYPGHRAVAEKPDRMRLMDAEDRQYLRTMRLVLEHPLRSGTCQLCKREHVKLYRLATRDVCESCVKRGFKAKLKSRKEKSHV